jgi:hypothetical protein
MREMEEAPKKKLWFYQWFIAIFGAAVIGVTVPAMLVSLNSGTRPVFIPEPDFPGHSPHVAKLSLSQRVDETLQLVTLALMACGPLVLLLGTVVLSLARARAQSGYTMGQVICGALLMGAALSFANLPAWGVTYLIPSLGWELWLKVFLLFAVAGSTAGAWIGWQAWRVEFPDTPVMPPFSLKVLMLVVLAWGGLLAVFMPR